MTWIDPAFLFVRVGLWEVVISACEWPGTRGAAAAVCVIRG